MTGSLSAKKQRRKLTGREKVLFAVLGTLLVIGLIGFMTFGRTPSDEESEQVQAQAAKAVERSEQLSDPLQTYADTDEKRRYGYDVLYAHDGLRIVLTSSKLFSEDPVITFDIINDSKKERNVQLVTGAIDNSWFPMEMDCTVGPKETASASTTAHSEYFERYNILIVRLCFKITNTDTEDGYVRYSEPISIKYDKFSKEPHWSITGETISRLETEDIEVLSGSYRNTEEDGMGVMINDMYIWNNSPYDIMFHPEDVIVIDADDEVIPPEDYTIEYEGVIPGNCLYNKELRLTMKDSERMKKIVRIGMNLVTERINDSDSCRSDRMGISHRID